MAIGNEILSSGRNFMDDIQQNVNPRMAFKTRAHEAYENLKNKAMHGRGIYKAAKYPTKNHLPKVSRAEKTKGKKITKKKKQTSAKKKNTLKQKVRDIFSK